MPVEQKLPFRAESPVPPTQKENEMEEKAERISRLKLYEMYKGLCMFCGVHLPIIDYMEACRLIPAKDGGKYTYKNCRCGCKPCNRRMGERNAEEAGMLPYTLKTIHMALSYGEEYEPTPLHQFEVDGRMTRKTLKDSNRRATQLFFAKTEGYNEDYIEVLIEEATRHKEVYETWKKKTSKSWAEAYPLLDRIVCPALPGIGSGLLSEIMFIADFSKSISSIRNYIAIAPNWNGQWPKRRKGDKSTHNHMYLGKSWATKKVGTAIRRSGALTENKWLVNLLEARKVYCMEDKGMTKGQAEFEASAYCATQIIKTIKCCLDGLPFHISTWFGCPEDAMTHFQGIVEEYQSAASPLPVKSKLSATSKSTD